MKATIYLKSILFSLSTLLVIPIGGWAQNMVEHTHTNNRSIILRDHIDESASAYNEHIADLFLKLSSLEKKFWENKQEKNLTTFTGKELPGGEVTTTSFHLFSKDEYLLQESLIVLSEGAIQIDGDIAGVPISNSNADGQDLILKSYTSIIINGDIRLSNGGNGQLTGRNLLTPGNVSSEQVLLATTNDVKNSLNKAVRLELTNGGAGGDLYLEAPCIVLNGKMIPGNGGKGIKGGNGGDGGSLVIVYENNVAHKDKVLTGGNGGKRWQWRW